MGGSCNRDAACLDRDELTRMVHSELADLLGISGEPVLSRCRQWARSLPQYELGHTEKVATIDNLYQRQPGLYVTGNYLRGVSVASCIEQARITADKVHRFLPLVSRDSLQKSVRDKIQHIT